MKNFMEIINTHANWILNKIEFNKYIEDENAEFFVDDNYNIASFDNRAIKLSYSRSVYFDNETNFKGTVSYVGEIYIKNDNNKVNINEYDIPREIEKYCDNIFYEVSSMASYLLASITMQMNEVAIITPPMYIKNKDDK